MVTEMKMRIRMLRDASGQDVGLVAACNAVLGDTASNTTRARVLRLASSVDIRKTARP